MELKTETFCIEIMDERDFDENPANNFRTYDAVYTDNSEFLCYSMVGIRVYQNDEQIASAIIGASAGGTSVHSNMAIAEKDRILLCGSNYIFCLSLPALALQWKTEADNATCFEIFPYRDSYIIHGEMEISRIDRNGNILWQQGGADIFTTISGKDDFKLTEKNILATDWENNKYIFDYDGQVTFLPQRKKHFSLLSMFKRSAADKEKHSTQNSLSATARRLS